MQLSIWAIWVVLHWFSCIFHLQIILLILWPSPFESMEKNYKKCSTALIYIYIILTTKYGNVYSVHYTVYINIHENGQVVEVRV